MEKLAQWKKFGKQTAKSGHAVTFWMSHLVAH